MNEKITVPPVIKDVLNKPEFPDNWPGMPGICPTMPTHCEFDWEGLYAAMAEPGGPEHLAAQLSDSDRQLLANVLQQILKWTLDADRLDLIGMRTAALCWLISPGYFEGGPSCNKLAKRFGLKKARFSIRTAAARREFKIQNRASSHAGNFKK